MEVGLAVFFVAAVVALPKNEMADRDPSLDPLVGDVVSCSAEDWENDAIRAMQERDQLARVIRVLTRRLYQSRSTVAALPGSSNHKQDSDGAR